MTEKDLKKLNRKQVLELLLKQTERADKLQRQLEEAESKLNDRALIESEAGSIAEASLKLNGVFEAAEAAASQYLENIKKIGAEVAPSEADHGEDKAKILLAEAERLCAEREVETDRLCAERIAETEKRCAEREAETDRRCAEREAVTEAKFKKLSKVLRLMYTEKKLLDSIFKDFKKE